MAPHPPEAYVQSRSLWRHFISACLRICGWRSVVTPLPSPKGIIVVYPHTSNWDFMVGVFYKVGTGLPARWVGKHTLFRWPLKRLLLYLGGIPVRRDQRSGSVEAMLAEFDKHERMWLAVTPEGTRARTEHWKSGFYRIALQGKLPLALGYIDYATHTVGIDTYLTLTGDVEADFARIREFYAHKRGRVPQNAGPIRLRE